jgi:hypothetical protein
MIEETKTANQLYKDSGSTLPFKEWIEQEKEKGTFIKNDTLTNVVESVLNSKDMTKPNLTQKNSKILGLSKPVIVVSLLIIASAIGYKIYSSKKN